MKEAATDQENKSGEKDEEEGTPKAGFTSSVEDDEKSKELKEAVTEQENELMAKSEVVAKPETSLLPSNIDEEESEGMKQSATEQKNEMEEKLWRQGNQRLDHQKYLIGRMRRILINL